MITIQIGGGCGKPEVLDHQSDIGLINDPVTIDITVDERDGRKCHRLLRNETLERIRQIMPSRKRDLVIARRKVYGEAAVILDGDRLLSGCSGNRHNRLHRWL